MAFTLRDIPAAMRVEGFAVGAAMMERWLNAPARQMPDDEKRGLVRSPDVEGRRVTMRWARQFGRVRQKEEELLREWSQERGLAASRGRLSAVARQWWGRAQSGDRPFRFGDLSRPTRDVDADYINSRGIVTPLYIAVDDFYAAVGNATVKLAAAGVATPLGQGRIRLSIEEIGTYVRDTYDFNGDQMLGSWGPSGIQRMSVLAPEIPIVAEGAQAARWQRFWSVDNGSFRKYRAHYGRGGDFTIFTDVRRQKLTQPVAVETRL